MKSSVDRYSGHIKTLQRALMLAAVVCLTLTVPLSAGMMKVTSEQTFTTFKFPESVAYDPEAKVLYVSEFGSQLQPTLKDGKGGISKVSLSGKVLEQTFLPAPGGILNKPKGIWAKGNRL